MLSILCLPEGEDSDKRTSGTPETLAVNAIDPVAKAERGRPDGAIITDKVSTISTYSSLDVCLTFARRQGSAGVDVGPREDIPGI